MGDTVVLELLRAIRADVAGLRGDVAGCRERIGGLEEGVPSLSRRVTRRWVTSSRSGGGSIS